MKTIYIIDDSKFMLKILEDKLQKIDKNLKLILIQNPIEIKTSELDKNVVAMIIDYNMPGINGIDLINELKLSRPDIMYLLLSASTKFANESGLPSNILFAHKPISDIDLMNFISSIP